MQHKAAIETERLMLRPWRDGDAQSLYEYAKSPEVGPAAGWLPHTSVEYSRQIIKDALSAEGTYAITVKGKDEAVGSISFFPVRGLPYKDEPEIGYWLGVPYWGRGFVPEAVRALLRIAFQEHDEHRVWCGYYEGNDKSRRVVEKCGFKFFLKQDSNVSLLGEKRIEYFYCITKNDWVAGARDMS